MTSLFFYFIIISAMKFGYAVYIQSKCIHNQLVEYFGISRAFKNFFWLKCFWFLHIILCFVFCVLTSWVNCQKYGNFPQYKTDRFASLKTWRFLRLRFSFSGSRYDVTVIKKTHTLNCYLFLPKFLLKT